MYDMTCNNIITVNRGDSFTISLPIDLGNPICHDYYRLTDNDRVYFGLMEPHQPFEHALIRKVFTVENQEQSILQMEFLPQDTECLLPGIYYYSLKLVQGVESDNPVVITFMPKTKFVIID